MDEDGTSEPAEAATEEGIDSGEPTLVEADPDAGFNYPYYLYVPDSVDPDESVAILAEPHNVAGPTDEFGDLLASADRRVNEGFGRAVAEKLGVPFLLAVFPRPISEPVDWTHFTHSLDVETLSIEEGSLERIDLQLLDMVDDARDRLGERGYAVRDQFSLNGFSAVGSFVNRFTALHPERLLSVSAGGLNGVAIVPQAEVPTDRLNHPLDVGKMLGSETLTLDYHVGVANLDELTGEPFDLAAYREVNQFLYMGGEDDKDALLYPDAWTDLELRMPAILLYGADIHDQRWPTCKALYDEAGASAIFRVYEGVGHEPGPALGDIVAFHERSHAGDDIDEIRSEIGGTPVE
jgi:hypothetical protein